MNTKIQPSKNTGSSADVVKYALAVLLIAAGLFAFYWFAQWPAPVRVLAVVAGLIAAGVVFLATTRGSHTKEFLSEARFELRKVVWPSMRDARRTTVIVMGVVVIISLLLALFDLIIQSAVKALLSV